MAADSKDRFLISVSGMEIEVTRKKIKNAYIRIVPPNGDVRMSVPYRTSMREIMAMAEERAGWIRQKKASFVIDLPSAIADGEELMLWGKRYTVKIIEGNEAGGRLKFTYYAEDSVIFIETSEKTDIMLREKLVRELFRIETEREMRALIPKLELRTGLSADTWNVRYMTSRWGSCNSARSRISISTRLAAYPLECLEMVMIHELCHTRVHGHGKDFYRLMDMHCPNWRRTKKILK